MKKQLASGNEKVYTCRIVLINNQTMKWYNDKKEVSFLEEIIREIVDADKEARHRVDKKQQESRDIQNLIQKQKEDIKAKYQEESKALYEKKRANLDQELSSQQQEEKKNYEEAIANLTKHYEDHKEVWVKEIFDRCLGL